MPHSHGRTEKLPYFNHFCYGINDNQNWNCEHLMAKNYFENALQAVSDIENGSNGVIQVVQ